MLISFWSPISEVGTVAFAGDVASRSECRDDTDDGIELLEDALMVRVVIGVALILVMLLPVHAQGPPRTAPSTPQEVKGCKYSHLRNDAATVAIVGAEPSHNDALMNVERVAKSSGHIVVIFQTYPTYGLDEERSAYISAVIEKSGAGILYHCSSPKDQRMLLERLQTIGMLRAQ